MSTKSEIQLMHECWLIQVKPILDNICSGKLDSISKNQLLKQCFEKYPISVFRLEYMIEKFYVENGDLKLDALGFYVKRIYK